MAGRDRMAELRAGGGGGGDSSNGDRGYSDRGYGGGGGGGYNGGSRGDAGRYVPQQDRRQPRADPGYAQDPRPAANSAYRPANRGYDDSNDGRYQRSPPLRSGGGRGDSPYGVRGEGVREGYDGGRGRHPSDGRDNRQMDGGNYGRGQVDRGAGGGGGGGYRPQRPPTSPENPHLLMQGGPLQSFFSEVENLQRGVDRVAKNIQHLQSLQGRALNSVSSQDSQRLSSELEELSDSTAGLLGQLRSRLRELSQQTKSMPVNADTHARRGQQSALAQKLMELATRYNAVQSDYKQKSKQRMEREIKIARPDATPAEIQRAIESGGGGFTQQLLSSRVADQRRALNEVQNRQEEIRKIERSMEQVLELFMEMQALVESQQEMINTIETNVEYAVVNLEEGSKEMAKAVTYRRNTRKKMWWLVLIVIILVIVIAIVVYLYVVKPLLNK